jgi:putative restriction endonuclease
MREVSPGDLVFSFVDTWIAAIGLAKSYCSECPKPTEFGSVGLNWENIGWRVAPGRANIARQLRPSI